MVPVLSEEAPRPLQENDRGLLCMLTVGAPCRCVATLGTAAAASTAVSVPGITSISLYPCGLLFSQVRFYSPQTRIRHCCLLRRGTLSCLLLVHRGKGQQCSAGVTSNRRASRGRVLLPPPLVSSQRPRQQIRFRMSYPAARWSSC